MVHIIYLHQGHMEVPSDIAGLAICMSPLLDGESYLSQANPHPFSTLSGIDTAADRVVKEVTELIEKRPEINAISFVGVSLGGCILERAAQKLFERGMASVLEWRYFITFASPLNGFKPGFNIPSIAAKLFGWIDITLADLVRLNSTKTSIKGVEQFHTRICLANLKKDWRVPLSSAVPVGGNWPWFEGTHRVVQTTNDGTSCVWIVIILDLSTIAWNVHHEIVTNPRSMLAIREVVGGDTSVW